MTSTIQSFTNPFTEHTKDLTNFVTNEVMPDNVKNDLITQPTIGQALFNTFVENRIKTTTVNLWVPIKKCQLKTWKTTEKRLKMTAGKK